MTFKKYYLNSLLNECTSVASTFNGKIVLVKNRDRAYVPTIKVVRELINGIELVYLHDENTDYSEGMNSAGIGIINTTLQGKKDEQEGTEKRRESRNKINSDGYRIRKALSYSEPEKAVQSLDLFNRGLGGHSIVGYSEGFYSIEKLSFGKPAIKKHSKDSLVVRTNHGISYPAQGYQVGKDRESSLARAFYANKEARKSETPEQLLLNLRKHHPDVPGYKEPYRTNYKSWTSSQLLLNLTDFEFTLVLDENTNFLGIENRLPKQYNPKIKVNIQKLEIAFNLVDTKTY